MIAAFSTFSLLPFALNTGSFSAYPLGRKWILASSSKYCFRVYASTRSAATHQRHRLHRLEIDEILAAELPLVLRRAPLLEHAQQRDMIAESMHKPPLSRHHFVPFLHRRAEHRPLRQERRDRRHGVHAAQQTPEDQHLPQPAVQRQVGEVVSERRQRDGRRPHDGLDLLERLQGAAHAVGGGRSDAAAQNGQRVAELHAERLQTERLERGAQHFGGRERLHPAELRVREQTEDEAAADAAGAAFALLGGGLRDPDLLHLGEIAERVEDDALLATRVDDVATIGNGDGGLRDVRAENDLVFTAIPRLYAISRATLLENTMLLLRAERSVASNHFHGQRRIREGFQNELADRFDFGHAGEEDENDAAGPRRFGVEDVAKEVRNDVEILVFLVPFADHRLHIGGNAHAFAVDFDEIARSVVCVEDNVVEIAFLHFVETAFH